MLPVVPHIKLLSKLGKDSLSNKLALTLQLPANVVLKVKSARLGSVDKESNYLMKSNAVSEGGIFLLKESGKNVRTLNMKTKKSTNYAVLVIRDELKAQAKGAAQILFVCGVHDQPKRRFLKSLGLSVASEWYVGEV